MPTVKSTLPDIVKKRSSALLQYIATYVILKILERLKFIVFVYMHRRKCYSNQSKRDGYISMNYYRYFDSNLQ